MIVTTDVPKVPPILVSANTMAALSGKAATTLLIIVYLTKFKIILVTACMEVLKDGNIATEHLLMVLVVM